jgi:2-polyprenyl-6-hydroxyphenyl methylase/3-demethylubiquinone-9 3-methyltransferase
MQEEHITFSFGENWKNFLTTVGEEEIKKAEKEIKTWLGENGVNGKRVIDIGCGSGIHSSVLYSMGAKELVSFDYDKNSVEATTQVWKKADSPSHWHVVRGSVLDKDYLKTLGKFDIVYSWGVLHHTGEMWKAIENSIDLVNDKGEYWIAIYIDGPNYQKHLDLKRKYNKASAFGKKIMVYQYILRLMVGRLLKGKNPFSWNKKTDRGMNIYHDIIDWLGGLPYEVASRKEIEDFCNKRGLQLKRTEDAQFEGGCSIYLFAKS